MTDLQKRKNAKKFVEFWKNHSKIEKQDDQTFWNMFLRDILDVNQPEKIIKYQAETDSNKTNWIDAWIKSTGVIIEQKSAGVDLLKRTRQSDGRMLNAYEQAKNYDDNMNKSNKSNWIITCNFDKFLIYDMNDIKKEYIEINLEDLPSCYDTFLFLVNKEAKVHELEVTVSKEAGKIIGNIYTEIEKLLKEQDALNDLTRKHLNEFCVRLVFCCFAEDSGMFAKGQFRNYVEKSDINHLQNDLLELFEVLNEKERRPFLREDLKDFPYVNGELFADRIDIPPLNETIKSLILNDACDDFDWSKINPTIFGAIFESTLNPETRRSGGMHYTSIENIHKVIDPLFLDELKNEFSNIRKGTQLNKKITQLENLQNKISNFTFLDPACGSGNFLTETYMELRKLENNILREIIRANKGVRTLFSNDVKSLIKVHIQQFYGIEVNDFAVAVSKTALWIAEYQMYLETDDIYDSSQRTTFLPLDSYNNIVESNALEIDWNNVISKEECSYIMGNPPFVGGMYMNEKQKNEIRTTFNNTNGAGEFDYVTGWYKKACDYMIGTNIKASFVSTNSICQGEQVTTFWKYILTNYDININYAFTTFVWDSEAKEKAKVHCIIIGFTNKDNIYERKLYSDANNSIQCNNINPYLIDAPTFFIEAHSNPICDVPKMRFGSMPRDGGGFVLTPEERDEFIRKEPLSEKWIKPYVGAVEFINNKERYCLWLKGAEPSEINQCPMVKDRIEYVKKFRLDSKAEGTRRYAAKPTLFCQIAQPDTNYIIVPKTSSGRREYVPLGFKDKDTIASDLVFLIPDANLYEFGVLSSIVHMAWLRVVCGRLKSDYRYSKDIVYNDFIWPECSNEAKAEIEKTAQQILNCRNNYPNSSLKDLYDSLTMPPDLVEAHKKNDKAVLKAYGFKSQITESEIVSKLMKLYQEKTKEQ